MTLDAAIEAQPGSGMLKLAPLSSRLIDMCSNGRFFHLQPVKLAALSLMSVALLACAPSPARSDVTQEKRMQGTPPLDDVRAEQDRVAALNDEILRELGADSAQPAKPVEELAVGPALTAESLEAGILRLIADIAGPEQTQPDFVGTAFAVALMPDSRGRVKGVQGRLDAGGYEIAVWPLYRENPGQHVAIDIKHPDKNQCVLTFDALTKALTAAGYAGKPLPRSLDPSVSFSKSLGAINSFVRLDTDRHDAPRCVRHVSFNLGQSDD